MELVKILANLIIVCLFLGKVTIPESPDCSGDSDESMNSIMIEENLEIEITKPPLLDSAASTPTLPSEEETEENYTGTNTSEKKLIKSPDVFDCVEDDDGNQKQYSNKGNNTDPTDDRSEIFKCYVFGTFISDQLYALRIDQRPECMRAIVRTIKEFTD